MILKEIDGQKVYWCHGCGHSEPLQPGNSESGKYKSKYGSPTKSQSFMVSQPRKATKPRKQIGSVNDQLSQDDVDDIRKSTGISPN